MSSMTVPLQSATTVSSTSAISNNTTSSSMHCSNNKKQLLHKQLPSNTDDVCVINSSYTSSVSRTNSSYTSLPHEGDKKLLASSSIQKSNQDEDGDQTKVTAVPGLPSPTDSISETSDYQRSTPSPKTDEQDSGMGKQIKIAT